MTLKLEPVVQLVLTVPGKINLLTVLHNGSVLLAQLIVLLAQIPITLQPQVKKLNVELVRRAITYCLILKNVLVLVRWIIVMTVSLKTRTLISVSHVTMVIS